MNTDKFTSGKFWLCMIAGLCLAGLTLTACRSLWMLKEGDVSNGIASVLGMLNTLLTAIVTHYFTKKAEQ